MPASKTYALDSSFSTLRFFALRGGGGVSWSAVKEQAYAIVDASWRPRAEKAAALSGLRALGESDVSTAGRFDVNWR